MSKAFGILLVGLGILLVAIGVKGNQSQVLAELKAVNPRLRQTVGAPAAKAGGASTTSAGGNNTGAQAM